MNEPEWKDLDNLEWKRAIPLIEKLTITPTKDNGLVTIGSLPAELECVGLGTDAAVFVYTALPQYAFKVYAAGKEEKRKNEEQAYQKLKNHPSFPAFYGTGDRYIVISYEAGTTLYDCLVLGIEIPPWVIEKVDEAIAYARKVGLNPRDIHLKNIILQDKSIKLIDVSEYVQPGNDERWDHLKEGYRLYYPFIASRKIPSEWIEFAKEQYKKHKMLAFSAKAFVRWLTSFPLKDSH